MRSLRRAVAVRQPARPGERRSEVQSSRPSAATKEKPPRAGPWQASRRESLVGGADDGECHGPHPAERVAPGCPRIDDLGPSHTCLPPHSWLAQGSGCAPPRASGDHSPQGGASSAANLCAGRKCEEDSRPQFRQSRRTRRAPACIGEGGYALRGGRGGRAAITAPAWRLGFVLLPIKAHFIGERHPLVFQI